MDVGRGACHAISHVLARSHRDDTNGERYHRVLLPVPDVTGQRLRQRHGHVQVSRLLRGATVHHRLFLLPDGPPPHGVHA